MPAAFIGHGSPTNALESNVWTEAWSGFAQQIPRPRAILAISAHWYINATAVTAMSSPATIHDFYGFSDDLFAVQYQAPGSPHLAEEVADLVKPTWVGQDADSWGLDHGTWSILTHMYPDADVPVVQLSIDASEPPDYHVELGAALNPLRQDGVLIVASGNVVHNLRQVQWQRPNFGFDWAREYDETATELMAERPSEIARLFEHKHHHLAAPTPDHLLPLFYIAGLAATAEFGTEHFAEGCHLGGLSMTSHRLEGAGSVSEDPG
ncbi:MAG: 4,5-DOPA dioxygenase extradiol [Acidimicrobiales bacterium]|nr:4,5-DOPA dioxygenase extradiol [Acidimicrobiales bacterium]RZV46062.1 MAG: 4,5-DOPA dioxygenase extradiol [Acidimicrobiales bacterium]